MHSPTLALRADPSNPRLHCAIEGEPPSSTLVFMSVQVFGSNAAWLLFGFLATQTYTYYTHSSKDHPLLKMLVYGTVLIVMVESVIEDFVACYSLISNWGNPGLLTDQFTAASLMNDMQPLFSALPGIIVQSYFTWRIWTFSMAIYRRKIVRFLVAAICLFIILTSICAFVSAIIAVGSQLSPKPDVSTINIALLTWTVPTAVVDVTITLCMIAILRHAKSSAYFGETHHILSRLLRLTIQTGFLTSLVAIPVAPLFRDLGSSGTYTLLWFLLGKLYAISLLANLNARSHRSPPIFTDGKDDKEESRRPGTAPLSHMSLTPSPDHNRSEANVTSGNGIFRFVRSLAHTIHRDLTTIPPEDAPEGDGYAQPGNVEGHPGLDPY